MILTEKQIADLTQEMRMDLLNVLYGIEDRLDYKCKRVTDTINYLQSNYIKGGK